MVVARQALCRTSIRLGTACALRIFAYIIFYRVSVSPFQCCHTSSRANILFVWRTSAGGCLRMQMQVAQVMSSIWLRSFCSFLYSSSFSMFIYLSDARKPGELRFHDCDSA